MGEPELWVGHLVIPVLPLMARAGVTALPRGCHGAACCLEQPYMSMSCCCRRWLALPACLQEEMGFCGDPARVCS